MEGLLAALIGLVDIGSEEGRRQLPSYRVRRTVVVVVVFSSSSFFFFFIVT